MGIFIRQLGLSPALASMRCVMAHGIMGSSQNWLGAARQLTQLFPEWSITLLDLPGHGSSSGELCEANLTSIADCISDALSEMELEPDILVGHSFGGKVMIELSSHYRSKRLDLWLLDAPIDADRLVTGSDTIKTILDLVDGMPEPTDRQHVMAGFLNAGLSQAIGQWMTTNLKRTSSGFVWKIDTGFVRLALEDYVKRGYLAELESRPSHHNLHCVLAGKGTWWRGEMERRLRRLPNTNLVILHKAGHWLHIDDLMGLLQCFQRAY